MNKATQS
jgi:hypothetical protein